MRKVIAILLSAEFVAAMLLGQCGHLDSSTTARTFTAWYRNPTPDTRSALDRQKRINEYSRIGFSLAVFVGMAGVTLFLTRTQSRRRRSEQT